MYSQISQTTKHYLLLDGLRGIAALMVLLYHLNEAVAFAAGAAEQQLFHGFLGVDFFFILSGFVMGYAYDERWNTMSVGQFIKRRLIRLHPMVVFGVVVGIICFAIQGFTNWDGERATTGVLMVATLLAMFLLPTPQSLDVRGNTEAFPINGPHWSLFFEYIGSLLYGICIHKMKTKYLVWLVICPLVAMLVVNLQDPSCGIAYGWSSDPINLLKGFLRLLYGYPMGLLLVRIFRRIQPSAIRKIPVFTLCSIALIVLFSIPSLTAIHPAIKIWYEIFCIAIAFPLILLTAARGDADGIKGKIISFLGRLSYPLYAVHYPFVYLYIYWINTQQHPFGTWTWASPLAVAIMSIVVATLALIFYDEPIRRYLTRRWL